MPITRHLQGSFARVIDYPVDYAQSLIDSFSIAGKPPHIAVSVDMLDTGIDVPEVVNLVFLKLVRSKTTFWQMIGRGTRLCPDVFGPGRDKAFFAVFDLCQNLESFSQDAPTVEGSVGDSLGARLFKTRLDLLGALDDRAPPRPEADTVLRAGIAKLLRADVAAMNPDNILVRPRRRPVETYAEAEAWAVLDEDARRELAEGLANLPTQRPPENGVVDAGRLHESPYTDLNPLGVDGLIADDAATELFAVLDEVKRRAAA